jgi:hypothetical protein
MCRQIVQGKYIRHHINRDCETSTTSCVRVTTDFCWYECHADIPCLCNSF